jgi:ketosteroid isomerase-like protein
VESDHLRAIRTGLGLFNEGEYERSIAQLAPQIEWDTSAAVPDGVEYRGHAQVLAFWRELAKVRWADFRIEPERWIDGGDVVLMLGRLNARGAESGVPVESTWDQVWRIAEGLPVRCENYTDRDRAWRESGLERDG